MLEHSEACERNKEPILAVLREAFVKCETVFEVGSGTGQHAVHFAKHLPGLQWQPSDRARYLVSLRERVALEGPPNLLQPLEFDVNQARWPAGRYQAVFSANTLHIMGWPEVEALFAGLPGLLAPGAMLVIYGPFRYAGRYTSASNASFDESLRARDPASGIRDFEAVDALARRAGLALVRDQPMPANNQALAWRGNLAAQGSFS